MVYRSQEDSGFVERKNKFEKKNFLFILKIQFSLNFYLFIYFVFHSYFSILS